MSAINGSRNDLKWRRTNRPLSTARPIRVVEGACDPDSPQATAADKLVRACHENVRFLNRHLAPFDQYLDLPPLIDNVLYLAYTVRVKAGAPFKAADLRRWLSGAQIDTALTFRFTADRCDTAGDGGADSDSFCIACHQYLTILDLEQTVEAFESFFASINADNRELTSVIVNLWGLFHAS
jgi:hypothetical protein